MEGKLRQLMKHEGINSTRLAEILGIQASGISHIMSGRNKPSFDFLLKLLQRFPQINPDWLMLDKGPMYRDEIKIVATSNAAMAHPTSGGVAGEGNERAATDGTQTGLSGAPTGPPALESLGKGGRVMRHDGLFGPDNEDIIPITSHPGTYPTTHRQTTGMGREDGRAVSAAVGGEIRSRHGQANIPGLVAGMVAGGTGVSAAVEQAGYATAASARRDGLGNGPSGDEVTQFVTSPIGGAARRVENTDVPQTGQQTRQQSDYKRDLFVPSMDIERIVVFYRDKTFSEYRPE